MSPELDYLRTGILEDTVSDLRAILQCLVLAVEGQDRDLWNMGYEVARDYAGSST